MKRLLSVIAAAALLAAAGCSDNKDKSSVELDGKVYNQEFGQEAFSQLSGDIKIAGASFALPCTLMDIGGDFSFIGFVNENGNEKSKGVVLGFNGEPAAKVIVESEHDDSDLTDNNIISFSVNSDTALANPAVGKVSVGGISLDDTRELVESCLGKAAKESDVGDRVLLTYILTGTANIEFQFDKSDDKVKEITIHT